MIWQVQSDATELHVSLMGSTSGGVMVSLASSTGSLLELVPVSGMLPTHLGSGTSKDAAHDVELENAGQAESVEALRDVEAARQLVHKSRRAREALLEARLDGSIAAPDTLRCDGTCSVLSVISHLKAAPVIEEAEMNALFGSLRAATAISVLKELGLIRRSKTHSSDAWEYVEEQEALLRNLRTHLNLHFSMRQLRSRLEMHRTNLLIGGESTISSQCSNEYSVE